MCVFTVGLIYNGNNDTLLKLVVYMILVLWCIKFLYLQLGLLRLRFAIRVYFSVRWT